MAIKSKTMFVDGIRNSKRNNIKVNNQPNETNWRSLQSPLVGYQPPVRESLTAFIKTWSQKESPTPFETWSPSYLVIPPLLVPLS